MKLLYDAFTEPEPHYAQIIKADKLKPIEVYPKEENKHPLRDLGREGRRRHAQRQQGDGQGGRRALDDHAAPLRGQRRRRASPSRITNIEQTTDELHGFGLLDYNINVVVDPGETKTVTFKAKKPGVFPYYCTNFCSALHQEMQGYLIVKREEQRQRRADRRCCEARFAPARSTSVLGRLTGLARRGCSLRRRPRSCSPPPTVLPLWNLTMFAPQYPDGLRLDIYTHSSQGGNNGQDVKEINVLNHYIGMQRPRRTRTSPSSSGCRS